MLQVSPSVYIWADLQYIEVDVDSLFEGLGSKTYKLQKKNDTNLLKGASVSEVNEELLALIPWGHYLTEQANKTSICLSLWRWTQYWQLS